MDLMSAADSWLDHHLEVQRFQIGHSPDCLPDHLLIRFHHASEAQSLKLFEFLKRVEICRRQCVSPITVPPDSWSEDIDREARDSLGGQIFPDLLLEGQVAAPATWSYQQMLSTRSDSDAETYSKPSMLVVLDRIWQIILIPCIPSRLILAFFSCSLMSSGASTATSETSVWWTWWIF